MWDLFIHPNILSPIFLLIISSGNHVDVQHDLKYYGIPVSSLPINSDGIVRTDNHKTWTEHRSRVELQQMGGVAAAAVSSSSVPISTTSTATQAARKPPKQTNNDKMNPPLSPASSVGSSTANDTFPTSAKGDGKQVAAKRKTGEGGSTPNSSSKAIPITQPNPNDCLLGRGKAIDQHLGNCQFRHYVEHHPTLVRAYWNAPKSLKRRIVDQMRLDLQRDLGLRFLKEQEDGQAWELADCDAIRHKISRTLRRILQKRQQQQEKLLKQHLGHHQQHRLPPF